MTLARPYIPLSVRVQVAERQARESGGSFWALYEKVVKENQFHDTQLSDSHRLRLLLKHLFPDGGCQLDHDPALILRKFRASTGKYSPDANNPGFLFYRAKDDHLQKTTGRKPGALRTVTTKGSDIGLKTKFAKLERAPRQKQKIPARKNPWPKRSMTR